MPSEYPGDNRSCLIFGIEAEAAFYDPIEWADDYWKENTEMEKERLVGYSVSFCFRDMAEGKVDPEKVKWIFAGTAIEYDGHLEYVIERYLESYWRDCPKAAELFREFFKAGKVKQPRLRSGHGHRTWKLRQTGNYPWQKKRVR